MEGRRGVTGTAKRTPAVITKGAALAALRIVSAYRKRKQGVTDKATSAALKTIGAYVRQREAKARNERNFGGLRPRNNARRLVKRSGAEGQN